MRSKMAEKGGGRTFGRCLARKNVFFTTIFPRSLFCWKFGIMQQGHLFSICKSRAENRLVWQVCGPFSEREGLRGKSLQINGIFQKRWNFIHRTDRFFAKCNENMFLTLKMICFNLIFPKRIPFFFEYQLNKGGSSLNPFAQLALARKFKFSTFVDELWWRTCLNRNSFHWLFWKSFALDEITMTSCSCCQKIRLGR